MLNEIKFGSEIEPIRSHLRDAYRRGMDLNQNCLGVHGTSTIALETLIKTGILPGWSSSSDSDLWLPQRGDVYFFKPNDYLHYPEGVVSPIEQAESYGASAEARHRICQKFKLPIRYDEYIEFLVELAPDSEKYKETMDFLLRMGYRSKDIERIIKRYRHLKLSQGIVLAFHADVASNFPITKGDEGWRTETQENGLPYQFIYGIVINNKQRREDLEHLLGLSGFNMLYEIKRRLR
ncbi:hypothetical protein HYW87_02015 [Candidatus Roizmanbacteria bacterium]|nr:hypothetical protein [Candidatus Roizmanbacteria bacterium]